MARVLTSCVLALALLAAPARAADVALDPILTPWLERQTPEGTFTDWPGARVGGAGGYAESMLGLALASRGLAAGDAAMTAAGERALRWAIEHPASVTAGKPSVFEDLALATAYDTLGPRLSPELRTALGARVAGTVLVRTVGTRYSNHSLTEVLRLLTAAHAGVGLAPGEAVDAAGVLDVGVPRYAAVYSQRRRGVRGSVFSDPGANPIAYHALTLAFLARAVELLGPSATPELKATVVAMAEGSATLMAPDGDVAYWGRSQEESWALPFTAYGAQIAARLNPPAAPRMRALARRALERFRARHLGPGGLLLVPALGLPAPDGDERAGLDAYASLPAYTGLTALGLLWLDPAFPDGPIAALPADVDGAAISSGRGSRFATVRSGDRWWAVKLRPAHRTADDGRADFGLVAFKRRGADGHWEDALPLRPFDRRVACARGTCTNPPPSAGPVAVTSTGDALPIGDDIRLGTGRRRRWVTITGRFVKRDGTTFAPFSATYRPDVDGVRLDWTAPAGQAFRVQGLFDERGGPVCLNGTTLGNARSSLRLPDAAEPVLRPGLSSGAQRGITAATVLVRAATAGTLTAVYADQPAGCP